MTQTHASNGLRTTASGSLLVSESPGPGGPLRVGLIGLTVADRDQAAELADILSVFVRTGQLPAPQPPVSDDLRRYTESYGRFGRGTGYATTG